jgi:hypothetical protein
MMETRIVKNPINKTNQVNVVKSKLICPKWHLGQVEHGGKKTIGGDFLNQNS